MTHPVPMMVGETEILALARESNVSIRPSTIDDEIRIWECSESELLAFAAAVSAREREGCAAICEAAEPDMWNRNKALDANSFAAGLCNGLASAIRARGTKP